MWIFATLVGGERWWFGWTPHFFKSLEKRVFFGALYAFLHFFDPFLPQNYQMWGVRGQGLGGVEKNPNFFLEGFPKVLCFRLRNISWCCVACKAVWKIFFQTTKVLSKITSMLHGTKNDAHIAKSTSFATLTTWDM